jgi:hypothetical protein
MDRQQPRDLFDVMQLVAHEGITPGIGHALSRSSGSRLECMVPQCVAKGAPSIDDGRPRCQPAM